MTLSPARMSGLALLGASLPWLCPCGPDYGGSCADPESLLTGRYEFYGVRTHDASSDELDHMYDATLEIGDELVVISYERDDWIYIVTYERGDWL
jgi:hypothetical protein